MMHESTEKVLSALRTAVKNITKDDESITSPEATVKKPQPLVTGTPNPGYSGCDCATCKELNVDCEHCPICSEKNSEVEMAMYDSSIGKSYENCGCKSCKSLNLKCEDCKLCSESMKSYASDDEELDKWDNIEKSCWVGYTQRGVKPGRSGGMVPNCVPIGKDNGVEKAKSISVGDHVQFAVPKPPDKTEYAHGIVERIERSGKVTLSGTSETVEASSDNPVAVVRVYASTQNSGENGKRVKTDRKVVKPFSALRVEKEPISTEKAYELNDIEKASASKLKELVDKYNEGKEGNKRITVGTLQAVYRRGIGAYGSNPSSVRPNVSSAEQWAMGRVNAFMAGLRGRFPRKPFDLDLFPKGHPRSTSKSFFEDFATDVHPGAKVSKLFSDVENNIINKREGWGGSIFDLNSFKNND